ncbi:MAG: GyrI-like domain-containing protein [Bacteroidota bacterium]
MTPRIEMLSGKVLVGKRITTSLTENRTGELWKSFMPYRGKIFNAVSGDLISAQTYPSSYFSDFKPSNTFEKWAAVEVFDADTIPDDLETFTIRGGLYAVFEYKGPGGDSSIFQYIFGTWIPLQSISWTTGHISRCWGLIIKTMTPPPRKKSGSL